MSGSLGGALADLLLLSVKGAAVAVFVALLLAAAGRHLPPGLRHALWLLVFVRLLVPVAPASPFSLLSLGSPGAADWLPGLDPRLLAASLAGTATAGGELSAAGEPTGTSAVVAAVVLWLLGALLVAGRALVVERRLRRALRRAVPPVDRRLAALLAEAGERLGVRRRVPVLETSCVDSPALHGLLRPRILLPPRFAAAASEPALRHVLLHEMAHLRRRDLWWRVLAFAAAALHWFNPVAWIALRRLDAECDLACDAAVLSRLGEGERTAYGRTLLSAAAAAPAWGHGASVVALPLSTRHTLKRRIRMIARFRPVTRRRLATLSPLVLVAALVALTEAPAAARPAQPPDAEKERQRATLDAMRTAGTAMYAWHEEASSPGAAGGDAAAEAPPRFDWSRCPAIGHAELAELLVPSRVAELPATDGWGHPLEFCLDRTGRSARMAIGVRSAGRDGRFEGDIYRSGAFLAGDVDRDVVWIDGYFVAWPSADGR